MRILYYDCFSGICGDMNLAALLDLGVEPDYLRAELSKLGLDQEYELRVGTDFRKGIRGTRVDVVLKEHAGPVSPDETSGADSGHGQEHAHEHCHTYCHTHDHAHDHGHVHTHEHDHTHGHEHGHGQHAHHHAPHRSFRDIAAIIKASSLGEDVRRTSLAIFRKLAEAEAHVHGTTPDEVHFHEVGATDSIVDIVGATICFHRLGVDAVWASPVELGGGFVRCQHGLMPVPAPATAKLLEGIPTTRGAVREEMTTPTGAAILAALAETFTSSPALVLEKTGHGIGHRDTEIPNLLRVHLAQAPDSGPAATTRQARLLQCNIDDMTPEMLGVVMDLFLEHGAMDVHFIPILMKKNRPATCLSLFCFQEDEARFTELLFRHTTTLGIKVIAMEKRLLDVSFERLDTPLGSVTMKNALLHGEVIRSKPELEECRDLALRHGIPLGDVYTQIGKARKWSDVPEGPGNPGIPSGIVRPGLLAGRAESGYLGELSL